MIYPKPEYLPLEFPARVYRRIKDTPEVFVSGWTDQFKVDDLYFRNEDRSRNNGNPYIIPLFGEGDCHWWVDKDQFKFLGVAMGETKFARLSVISEDHAIERVGSTPLFYTKFTIKDKPINDDGFYF